MHLKKNNGCHVLMAEGIVVVVHYWMKEKRCHFSVYGFYWWSTEEKSQLCFPCVGHGLTVFPQEAV
jgi:hypothetical protein